MSAVPRSSLRANLAWILGGNLVYIACQWGMLVALARLGTPKLVGDFAFALALTAPIMIFAMLNMRAAQATDQRGEFSFADYVHVRVAALAGAILVVAILLAVGRYDRATVATVALVTLAKIGDALSDVVYGLLQKHERMRRIALSRIVQGVAQLGALSYALWATGSLVAAAAAMAAVSLAVTLSFDLRSVALLHRVLPETSGVSVAAVVRPRWHKMRALVVLSLPLGIAATLDALNANVPRYAIEMSGGRAALGFYAAIAYFLVGQGTVLIAVADAARPRLACHFLESREEFARLTGRLAMVAIVAAVLGLLVAEYAGAFILRSFYGAAYATQTELFVWIMAVALPWNLAGVVSTALSAARSFHALSLSFLVMALVTTVAAFVLVPHYGAIGAAWALGAGMIARLGVSTVALWRTWLGAAEPAIALGASAS